ncbi:putative HD phosphohydrolase [Murinocardiopsis flavida]|uniref:Putative HD phosphohydrolase n=1 Tax=Murinocardiopsis flavida TaxID=645275 RepID=A0A2P8CXH1_9ACTN|nr:HD domain-containing protein [Murinocardiopsis flavida]PSK89627.1 putative HD phosphohydrolase [Murinocardiopsis flavida]
MRTVSFRQMSEGTKEDYLFLAERETEIKRGLPDRLLAALESLKDSFDGYQVTRYEHSLQAATRAHRDGRPEDYVVATLLHDLGDDLAPDNHSEMAAAIVRPYVSEQVHWIVKHHGAFQMYYYAHHYGDDRNARDHFADSPHYQACVDFCELYDQASFDPDYDTLPLDVFEPMVRRVIDPERPWTQGA